MEHDEDHALNFMPRHEPNPNEPESLKQFSQMAAQAFAQGVQPLSVAMVDSAVAMKIYSDFKWSLRMRDFTYKELDDLLASIILRFEREIQTVEIRGKAIQKFQEARNRISEFTVEEQNERSEMCALHEMPKFICPCKKE